MRGISFAGVALALLLNGNPAEAATLRVADFGARGDGRTDDTAAVQRALDAVRSGDQLHFEGGRTYVISKSLQMRNKSGYTVVGNGATIQASASLPANKSANSYMILIWNNRNYYWRDLSFDGNRKNRRGPAREAMDQGMYHNIIIRGGADFTFKRVRSDHSYMDGFYIVADNPKDTNTFPRRGRFLNCIADYNWRDGLGIINGYDIEVRGGSYSYTDGDWPMAGIQIEPKSGDAEPGVRGVSIRHVYAVGNTGYGVGAASKGRPQDITVEYSYFADNARGGASLGGANMTIQDSVFERFHHGITSSTTRLNTVTRGTVDVPAGGTNTNARLLRNVFREIRAGNSGIYVHSKSGSGSQIRGNCFERLSVPQMALNNSRPAVSDNYDGGCPTRRQLLGW